MAHPRSRKFIFFIGWVLALVLLCYSLPALLFWPLCWKQDHDLPPNTEVIVSACKRPGAFGVPGGDVLFVREGRNQDMYLLNLHTGEKRDVPNDPLLLDHGVFLSSELVWLEGSSGSPGDISYRPNYILDLTDGQRYELLDLTWLPLLNGNKFDPKYYAFFQSAEQAFIHHTKNTLIALSPDFRQHPEGNVIFSQYSLESGASAEKGELLEQLMKNLGVDYEIIDLSTTRYADLPSPTGRYIVRNDGIYLSGTNTPVVTREYTGKRFIGDYFVSWYYDESGIVVRGGTSYSLINLPGVSSLYYIPSPILKLRLPQTYLVPTPSPQGTNFDLRVQIYKNNALVGITDSLCGTDVTRNSSLTKQVTLSFDALFTFHHREWFARDSM